MLIAGLMKALINDFQLVQELEGTETGPCAIRIIISDDYDLCKGTYGALYLLMTT